MLTIAGNTIIAITARIAVNLRQRGLSLPTERQKYWDARVWEIASKQAALQLEMDKLDAELKELAGGNNG